MPALFCVCHLLTVVFPRQVMWFRGRVTVCVWNLDRTKGVDISVAERIAATMLPDVGSFPASAENVGVFLVFPCVSFLPLPVVCESVSDEYVLANCERA